MSEKFLTALRAVAVSALAVVVAGCIYTPKTKLYPYPVYDYSPPRIAGEVGPVVFPGPVAPAPVAMINPYAVPVP